MTDLFYPLADRRIFIAGHRGMVGSALVHRLEEEQCEIVTADRDAVDLTRQSEVEAFVKDARPDCVIVAAARVGGILANNTCPAEFLYDNLVIETNLIHAAHQNGIDRLLFLGSSCAYPKLAPQPIPEDALLTGLLEPTNEPYAVAKIAGIKLCDAYRKQYGCRYISAMPTNLYGPNDNFDLNTSHVMPALIRKIYEAKSTDAEQVVIWGTGKPMREFMHVDDLADALVFLLERYDETGPINVGVSDEVSISQLAELICDIAGYVGSITFDTSKPDGTPRKLMDSTRLLEMGWAPTIPLTKGVEQAYRAFRDTQIG